MSLKQKLKFLVPERIKQIIITRKLYNSNKKKICETFRHYDEVLSKLGKKESFSFGAYVVLDSTFGASGLVDYLISDSRFSVKIVIVPDVSRGRDHMYSQYKSSKLFFEQKYGKDFVLDGYDLESGNFIDHSKEFDFVYVANPYDTMVNHIHSIDYLSTCDLLPFHINYCFQPDKYSNVQIMQRLELSLFWKVFAETTFTYNDYKVYEIIHGKNVVLSGYSKMDDLSKYCLLKTNEQKKIIIAPHHTINNGLLPLSNFDKYSDFFLRLPDLYPNVNFIFRPHPLLFTTIVNNGFWTQQQVDDYLTKLQNKGVVYSKGGDYLKIFAESDAIIHDCSSYIVEYLFTNKPCCFMSKKDNGKYLNKLGKNCLKYYTKAYSETDICNFINMVVNNEFLYNKKLEKFVKEKIAINYPNVSSFLYKKIKI